MKTLYRPLIKQSNFDTPKRFSRFIKQFVDLNDWGFMKRHLYSWDQMKENLANEATSHTLKDVYNYTLTFIKGNYFGSGKNKRKINTIDDIFLIDRKTDNFPELLREWEEKGRLSFKMTRNLCLEHHLWAARHHSKSNYLFYTSSPHKWVNLLCCDIDKIDNDTTFQGIADALSTLFPNCYYERSTNGTGLHFYIAVQYTSDRYLYDVNEGLYRNMLSYLLSEALRAFINTHFSAQFDAIKGTCPLYDINHLFIKYGALVKLPAPVTFQHFQQLYSCSVFPEHYLYYILTLLSKINL